MSPTAIPAERTLSAQERHGVGERALERVYTRANRWITMQVLLHCLIGVGLAFRFSTFGISAGVTVLAAGLYFAALAIDPMARATRIVAGISLQLFVMLHIYQLHGLGEMHFFFFTSTTAMILYQDPRAILPGVLVIIAQHTLFALITNMTDIQINFFEEVIVDVEKLTAHFSLALIQAAICIVLARGLRVSTLAEAIRNAELIYKQQNLELLGHHLERENARKDEELSAARHIQLSLLPPSEIDLGMCQLIAYLQTCTEVGGDYYDYKRHPNGEVTIALGDATGHGMRAAIMVACCRGMFQSFAGTVPTLRLMRLISSGIENLSIRGAYMGLTLIHITADGQYEVVSSGMPPLLWYRAERSAWERIELRGPFIGHRSMTAEFPRVVVEGAIGDRLVLFSDGLIERFDAGRKLLGLPAIEEACRKTARAPLDELMANLITTSREWQHAEHPEDDTTIITLEVTKLLTVRKGQMVKPNSAMAGELVTAQSV